MSRRILWLRPVISSVQNPTILAFLENHASEDTKLEIRSLDRGPRHLEYHYYSALVLSDVLRQVKLAEQSGFDAIVIACFYDVGLCEAREIAESITVAAPCESAIHIASSLGRRFSIIVGDRKWIPRMQDTIERYGFGSRLASFRSIEMGVLDFQKDREETVKRIMKAASEAVEQDMAEVVIPGCTMDFGLFREIQEHLRIPVIDPMLAPLKHAEFLVDLKKGMGWGISKIGDYKAPPRKEIKDWALEKQYGLGKIW